VPGKNLTQKRFSLEVAIERLWRRATGLPIRAGHLKPPGKPAPNARKWFATVEIERMSCDPEWFDKAVRVVKKQIQEMNKKQWGKEQSMAGEGHEGVKSALAKAKCRRERPAGKGFARRIRFWYRQKLTRYEIFPCTTGNCSLGVH